MTIKARCWRAVVSLSFVLLISYCFENAEARSEVPPSSGIWHSRLAHRTFAPPEHSRLVESLRRITGFDNLDFSPDGSLVTGDVTNPGEGSPFARQLLSRALSAGAVFIIEDHSKSPAVQFGQLDEGTDYEDRLTGRRTLIWRVRIDPDDFRGIDASPLVRASFDEGFAVFHELLHGLGYEDPREPGDVGECESLLNEVRSELGLPIRAEYFGTFLPLTAGFGTVRLRFQRRAIERRRTCWRNEYLYFSVRSEALAEALVTCRTRSE